MTTDDRTRKRTALFQELKPCCVQISQLAIRQPESTLATRQLVQFTGQLYSILEEAAQNTRLKILDSKLAEYVFFPLSHVFRQLDAFPTLLIENCIKCLTVLVGTGWEADLSPELAQQLLSLLAVIIDGKPGSSEDREVSEELLKESFRCVEVLFSSFKQSQVPLTALTGPDFLPTTGHAISIILDAVENGPHFEIQLRALAALQSALQSLQSQETFEAFLPGTVSALAKVLASPAKQKLGVLSQSIDTLRAILCLVLGDLRIERMMREQQRLDEAQKNIAEGEKTRTQAFEAWLEATSSQVRLALQPVMKLSTNDAPGVRKSLRRLCIALLDECHRSMAQSASFLVETAMILSEDDEEGDLMLRDTSLADLVGIYPELGDMVKNAVYSWMTGLPRRLQASDTKPKQMVFVHLSKGIRLLKELRIESSTLDETITNSVRDAIIVLMNQATPSNTTSTMQVQLLTDGSTEAADASLEETPYQSSLIESDQGGKLRSSVIEFLQVLATLPNKAKLTETLLETMQMSTSNTQIASFWLSYELYKSSKSSRDELDTFFSFGDDVDDDQVLGDLYAFSVETLEQHSEVEQEDWRLSFISMEVVSHAASKAGVEFRPELIDVLFPIATLMGSEDEQVRQQAIATLNSLARSCEYGSVSELFIANVDYVVNSVALRLNSLDVSPSSIAVLAMTVRLGGPKLVPFLDDVIDSIFAALENFHGYTSFVENLFSVLNEIVAQAVKADKAMLLAADQPSPTHRKERKWLPGLLSVAEFLEKRDERRKRDAEEVEEVRPDGPFLREQVKEEDQQDAPRDVEKPPSPPTYQLLQRITTLTQHYLTSPTPKLRRSLLDVVTKAAPVLGQDEESFLPLVNAIWPVVMDRLYDEERYVSIEACHTIASLCASAGDFLSSRLKTAWGEGLNKWCRRCKFEAAAHHRRGGGGLPAVSKSTDSSIVLPFHTKKDQEKGLQLGSTSTADTGSLGRYAAQAKLWEGVVKLLVGMVGFVRLDDEIFDEILDILGDELEKDEEVREALETVNADAVWLVRFERGGVELPTLPQLEGVEFADLEKLSRAHVAVSG